MNKIKTIKYTIIILFFSVSLSAQRIQVGAERMGEYISFLKGKKVAIVSNQTSIIGNVHLVDTLISLGIKPTRIFCPEHGFRGIADAGENLKNTKDPITGIRIISLYGKNKKPKPTDLKDIDIVIFDIQDVGVRFYTYLSTLHYVMEACAENKKQLIIFDRPNPNGFYIDGPVLDLKYKTFVGLHPVPIVYGMTIGEYAKMINGERWLKNEIQCEIKIITCLNYTHDSLYQLPVKPSPNLPNMRSVYLYPSLALFEGTSTNVGRGTDFPFQVFGSPDLPSTFTYTPTSRVGAKSPMHEGLLCHGIDLREESETIIIKNGFTLEYLFYSYINSLDKQNYFNSFFVNLAGDGKLRAQIESGYNEVDIKSEWQSSLKRFKDIRKKYLLYP